MTKRTHWMAHAAVLSANLIYGANYSIAKLVMPEYIKPFGFITLRVLFTGLLFLLYGFLMGNDQVEYKDRWRLFWCAVFGVAINQLLFFKGLDLTTPIHAALMMTTNPIMVLLSAWFILKNRITWIRLTGISLGITGACWLIFQNKQPLSGGPSVLGDVFILINALSFAIFLIMVKPLMSKYSTATVMKWVFMFGSVLVLPFGWTEFLQIPWHLFDARLWGLVAFVVIGTTTLAYVFNTYALKKLSAPEVSVYIYLQPVFAVMFAVLLGKDQLQWSHLVSAMLIFAGLYLASDRMSAPSTK
ncbi:MAG: DMT family transporter [Bacteroidia bacterium]